MAERIGFVGVGRMGANMARRLREVGFPVTAVYDVRPAAALDLAREHRHANGFAAEDGDFVEADVFQDLRARVAAAERWDVVVCDPPAFAKKKADVEKAARGYKDINRLAMALVAPSGWLLTCSCSGLVDADLFQKIVFSASLDARVPLAFAARQGAGPDHPVSLDCPEGEYLKGLWLRRSDRLLP